MMALSYLFSGGACIKGVFSVATGGLNDPATARIFMIAICFFIAGKILKGVIKRNG